MFIVVYVKSDEDVALQKRIFDREQYGYSQKFHVAAEGEVFLTRASAEEWIEDNNAYRAKNNRLPLDLKIVELTAKLN